MYRRAILRSYCDVLGLDKNEILQCYNDEITPHPEPVASKPVPHPSNIKIYTAAAFSLIIIFGTGFFLSREWLGPVLSQYFSSDSGSAPADFAAGRHVPQKTVRAYETITEAEDEQTPLANISSETANTAFRNDNGKTAETLPEQTAKPTPAAGNSNMQPLRLEIVGKEECWLSINSDESGAVTKILSPGDTEFFTASRTISLIVGNAAGISLVINDRVARTLGQKGEVVRLTIDKDTLQNLIDPSAS
jgi:cytoskeletal protein RodZ